MSKEERLAEIIRKAVNLSDDVALDENTDLAQIDINSLNFLKIIVDIEDEFDIEFDDEELNFELFGTIHSIIEKIDEKIEENNN